MAPRTQRMKNQVGPQSSHKRMKRLGVKKNTTTISSGKYLPNDLIESIFTFLPLKDAMSTAFLSTRFKNSWRFNRNLYFGKEFAKGKERIDYMVLVNRVFNRHLGDKIQRFQLYIDPTNVEILVNCWLARVILKGVEELDLDFSRAKKAFDLCPYLVDHKSIRSLKLNFCYLFLPQKLQGLIFLKTLVLEKVQVYPTLIKTLFSNCLLLEFLELVKCLKITDLKIFAKQLKNFKVLKVVNCRDVFGVIIDSPTLYSFHYRGEVCEIYFKCKMLNLNNVILNFVPSRHFPQIYNMSSLMMMGLSFVDVLTVSGTFLEGLSQRYVNGSIREPQFHLQNVKEFHIFVDGFSNINPYDIACFVKNCPHLEKLFIDLGEVNFECGYYWELNAKDKFENCHPMFLCLKSIKLMGFKFQKLEFWMVKFLLENARFLDTMDIVTSKNNQVRKFYSQYPHIYDHVFLSWKVSPCAGVRVFEYSTDKSSIFPKYPKKWF